MLKSTYTLVNSCYNALTELQHNNVNKKCAYLEIVKCQNGMQYALFIDIKRSI